jgi:hypothetical protein
MFTSASMLTENITTDLHYAAISAITNATHQLKAQEKSVQINDSEQTGSDCTQYYCFMQFYDKAPGFVSTKKYSPREGIKEPSPLGVGKGNSHA